MELLKPAFKLPEVAYGAGVSASNLTNWYDRGVVTPFCKEKDGWKRFAALDVFHVALIKQLVVLGVPLPYGNEIARNYLEFRLAPCMLGVPVSPVLFVALQHDEMLFVEPAGENYNTLSYDKQDGLPDSKGFPTSKRGHIILPVGPILETALSKALTGRDDIELEYNTDEGERYIAAVAKVVAETDKKPVADAPMGPVATSIVNKLEQFTDLLEKNSQFLSKSQILAFHQTLAKTMKLVEEDDPAGTMKMGGANDED